MKHKIILIECEFVIFITMTNIHCFDFKFLGRKIQDLVFGYFMNLGSVHNEKSNKKWKQTFSKATEILNYNI